jgi:2-polyprenyl-3-methyl-5-hydroxy-6-metoxy-1,4-benzoquinol methylase
LTIPCRAKTDLRINLVAEYSANVKDRTAGEWEELARSAPYFPVLTDEGVRDVEFLKTGEEDIVVLLAAIASILGRDPPLTTALDFGCGAGRLTLPLARRAARVVACDIAPTILEHARRNAHEAGLHNVTLIETGELAGLPDAQFDFVCSLLTFQHIPPAEGYGLMRTLLRLLAPGGVAAIQLTLEPPGGGLQRLARMLHASRLVHRVTPHDIRRPSWMQVNAYDDRVVNRMIAEAGASLIGRFSTTDGDTAGTVLVIEKPQLGAD